MIKHLLFLALLIPPQALLAQPGLDPLTVEDKFKVRMARAFEPASLLIDTATAGIDYAKNDPEEWSKDASGFAKRFGSKVGRSGIRQTIAFSLDSALHTDPRTYRSTHTGFGARLYDAVSQVVITRTDSGRRVPAIANVSSAFAAAQIQTIWMPADDAHFSDGLTTAGVMLAGNAARNVFKEFWPDIKRKLHHGN